MIRSDSQDVNVYERIVNNIINGATVVRNSRLSFYSTDILRPECQTWTGITMPGHLNYEVSPHVNLTVDCDEHQSLYIEGIRDVSITIMSKSKHITFIGCRNVGICIMTSPVAGIYLLRDRNCVITVMSGGLQNLGLEQCDNIRIITNRDPNMVIMLHANCDVSMNGVRLNINPFMSGMWMLSRDGRSLRYNPNASMISSDNR